MIGTLLFLHIIIIKAGPSPVSPFVMLYLLDGPASFHFDPAFLQDLEEYKSLSNGLEHWATLSLDAPVPPLVHPCGALLLEVFGDSVCRSFCPI